LQKEIAQLGEKNTELAGQLFTAETENGELKVANGELKDEIAQLDEDKTELQGKLADAETAKTAAETAKLAAETERDNALQAQIDAETAKTAAETAKLAAETERDLAQGQLTTAHGQITELNNTIAALNKDLADANARNKTANESLLKYTNEIVPTLQEQIKDLSNTLSAASDVHEQEKFNLTQELNTAHESIVEGIHADYADQLGLLFIQMNGLQAELDACSQTPIADLRSAAVKVFPNPSSGEVYINKTAPVKVYNSQGVLIMQVTDNKVDLRTYPQDVYLFNIDGEVVKVIKQ
ncbi:MAG: hypothetical protein LBU90_01990, partial [Bacteroidales bacterium]|jgi:chromosome segregation ATPase|nr:hypothetical protein [Bacteroidales bacterium]